ncbi:hypothetical protein BCV72DRAFT_261760 [Rhizopus microsporus var. microsporus]|uniref:Mid2 domain-containing protein n=2 Tax=Rhizopus microsporus TaxID=58291 RepID=A0A2G4SS60_RHIZD|nr:uncharacterized protein RHIMIDRAFT_313850 [Rhizopus microsporus ATCC 52813]ORE08004.1 hypothetical protein BCV72DRAFT_261760 [Rhizopus microsporus var. microsporus]PHZ11603.1 hypothetical protein RHIMIDRAFT_313850 [Rhizopus microsporus ATCC 52813]
MRLSLTSSAIVVFLLLQLVSSQKASGDASIGAAQVTQQQQPQPTSDTPPQSTPQATTTKDNPTTTNPPTSANTPDNTTPNTTNNPPTTTANPTTTQDPSPTATTTTADQASTTTTRRTRGSTTNNQSTTGNTDDPTPTSSNSPTSSTSATSSPGTGEPSNSSNKTATIAGSVVGGLVGIAVIAGALTWLNRHGGCASRTRRRGANSHDDFGNNTDDMKMSENPAGNSAPEHGAPASPFQHARRFVPPNTGYMNLTDEEYGYQQNNYPQEYHQEHYSPNEPIYEYNANSSAYQQSHQYQDYGYQQPQQPQPQHYYQPTSNITSPTLTNANAPLKPDQIEQKPNAL